MRVRGEPGPADHPVIVFESTSVVLLGSDSTIHELKLHGMLELRGTRRELEFPLSLELTSARLSARGRIELDASDWGVPQVSALGGSVKTKKKLELVFDIVALRE